jgi:TPR repeat protein
MNRYFPCFALSIIFWMFSPLALSAGLLEAGMTAHEQQDYKQAYELLLPIAEQGDAQAQYYVGTMLVDGMGVTADTAKGVQLLEQAVSNKHYKAAITRGKNYLSGYGVEMDTEKWAKNLQISERLATEYDAEPACD